VARETPILSPKMKIMARHLGPYLEIFPNSSSLLQKQWFAQSVGASNARLHSCHVGPSTLMDYYPALKP